MKQLSSSLKNRIQIRKVENRGRDISALLVGCKDLLDKYDYLCFIHDKNTSSDQAANIWEQFRFNMWENNLKSEFYINNIIDLFYQHRRLGLLVPPIPKHDLYKKLLVNGWSKTYDATKNLMRRLKINVPIEEDIQPLSYSTTFWCRTKALRPLFDYNFLITDFPDEPLPATGTINHAVERILPYIAQSQGFYTGIIECEEYASMEIILMSDTIKELLEEKTNLQSYNKNLKERLDTVSNYNNILKEKIDSYKMNISEINKKTKNQLDQLEIRKKKFHYLASVKFRKL